MIPLPPPPTLESMPSKEGVAVHPHSPVSPSILAGGSLLVSLSNTASQTDDPSCFGEERLRHGGVANDQRRVCLLAFINLIASLFAFTGDIDDPFLFVPSLDLPTLPLPSFAASAAATTIQRCLRGNVMTTTATARWV